MSNLIETGSLAVRMDAVAGAATASGVLQTIATQWVSVKDGPFEFIVRIAENIKRKNSAGNMKSPGSYNPFLPPDPDLFVGHLSSTHSAILNKFNVVDNHLLMVTRDYQSQESLLTTEDFQAMCFCLAEQGGMAFFNGGAAAGASQPHKHMQWVPLPLVKGWCGAGRTSLPVEVAVVDLAPRSKYEVSDRLPFDHLIAPLSGVFSAPTPEFLQCLYLDMLAELAIEVSPEGRCMEAYNLLLTPRWMLLVPRAAAFYATISVNSLAFAGSLFVKSQADLNRVQQVGPLNILKAVSRAC